MARIGTINLQKIQEETGQGSRGFHHRVCRSWLTCHWFSLFLSLSGTYLSALHSCPFGVYSWSASLHILVLQYRKYRPCSTMLFFFFPQIRRANWSTVFSAVGRSLKVSGSTLDTFKTPGTGTKPVKGDSQRRTHPSEYFLGYFLQYHAPTNLPPHSQSPDTSRDKNGTPPPTEGEPRLSRTDNWQAAWPFCYAVWSLLKPCWHPVSNSTLPRAGQW